MVSLAHVVVVFLFLFFSAYPRSAQSCADTCKCISGFRFRPFSQGSILSADVSTILKLCFVVFLVFLLRH